MKRMVNWLSSAAILAMLFSLLSCGSGLKISSKNLSSIDPSFEGSFSMSPYKTAKKNREMRTSTQSLQELLLLPTNSISDSVHISFSNNKMVVSYQDSLGRAERIYDGIFSQRGYYEYYFYKKKVQIPPLFPIIYGVTDISRIRINLTTENHLVLDDFFELTGNIFIIAGGSSYRNQHYFKRIE